MTLADIRAEAKALKLREFHGTSKRDLVIEILKRSSNDEGL